MNCSYAITDPSGELLQSMGVMLLENGYNVKLFSITDMHHSNTYNPMDYIYDSEGNIDDSKVKILVNTFVSNASNTQKKSSGDPFWIKSSMALLTSLVLYLAEFKTVEYRNFYNVLRLTQMGKTDEGPSATETELDRVFKAAEQLNPKAKCHSSYKTFHLAPPKTANSILISMAVDLDPFSIDAVRSMTSTSYLCNYDKNGFIKNYVFAKNPKTGVKEPIRASDNLDLRTIGDEKTALFINIPQTNSAYNFLISLMYSQLFDELYSRAEHVSPNRFHIYDKYGQVISSQYETEEAAKRAIYLYSTAEVREYEGHYYIYNPNATPKETLPEMNLKTSKKQSFTGYMREVYSVEVGEALIARYQTNGKHNEPEYVEPVEEEPIEEEILENEVQDVEEDDDTTVIEINLDTVKNLFGKAKGITSKIPQPKVSPKPKVHKSFSGQVSDGPVIKRGALRLPIHVRFLLDEFANIGEIPDFDKMLSTMRKYEISCTIILQSLAQIKAKYDKIWEVLVGNCDTMIFLGSSENETCKYVSEKLGKATIRTIDSSMSKGGGSGSSSTSFKKQARDLLDPAEVSKIDNKYCLVMIRGLNPFYVKKYPWEKHPNYGLTADADGSRIIDGDYLEEHFLCRSKITNKDDEFLASETRQSNVTNKKTTPSGKSGLGTPPVQVVDKDSAINAFNMTEGKSYQEQGKAFHSVSPEDATGTDVQVPQEKASKYGKKTATGKGKKKEKPDYAAPANNAEGSVAGGMKMPKNAAASGGGAGGLQKILDIAMPVDNSDAREKGERGYQTPEEPVSEEKRASGNVDAAKNMAASLGSGLGATSKPAKEKDKPEANPFELPFGDTGGLPFGEAPSIDSDDSPSGDSPESMDFVW